MTDTLERHRLETHAKRAEQLGNMAHNTGLTLTRVALFINAGALFALPAFLAAFEEQKLLFDGTLIGSGGCYLFGLISAALSGYCAYRGAGDLASYFRDIWTAYFQYSQDSENNPTEKMTILSDNFEQAHKKFGAIVRTDNLSIVFGFASYILFVLGCLLLAWFIYPG